MDSAYIKPRVSNPRQHPDLDRIFRDFFNPEQVPTAPSSSFDVAMYKKRMRITVEILLKEADAHGRRASQQVYLVIVGLGLGVWAVTPQQERYLVECFTEALIENEDSLVALGTLDFSYITVPKATQVAVQQAANRIVAKAIFTKRNPVAKLKGDDESDLLVISYAWDGNSFPGNEYWSGMLTASGDSAAVRLINPPSACALLDC